MTTLAPLTHIADAWHKVPGQYRVHKRHDGKPGFWWARFEAGFPREIDNCLTDAAFPVCPTGTGFQLDPNGTADQRQWLVRIYEAFKAHALSVALNLPVPTASPKPTIKPPCSYHRKSSEISVKCLVAKTVPITGYAVRMEERVKMLALEQVRTIIQRTRAHWPVCREGEVHLRGRLDRDQGLLTGEWYCTCGG